MRIVISRLADTKPTFVAFVNAHCMNIVFEDPDYLDALRRADNVFPDGMGMSLAGRWLGQPFLANVNGTDMFPLLCECVASTSYRIFLLGGSPGVAEKVKQWVETLYPEVHICGTHSGYFSDEETDSVVEAIRASRADLLFVAFGVPAQELWIVRNLKKTGAHVAIGVGGLFDFFSGNIPRAPAWVRVIGMEWVYRLIQEPKRLWRRYLIGNPLFLWRVFRARFALQRSRLRD